MKFLCGNCKAKYQIPDEKVAGKTLRMRCQRCGKDIIMGPRASVPPPPPPAAAAATAATGAKGGAPRASAPPAPSALRQQFNKQIRESAPSHPSLDLDHWHVAINDVPVGPVRRDEVERKIATGAVRADSLVWREGMDDWRRLGDVPELASLLRVTQATGKTRASTPDPAAMAPLGGRLGGLAGGSLEADEPGDEGEATRIGPAPQFGAEAATLERPSVAGSAAEVAAALAALEPKPFGVGGEASAGLDPIAPPRRSSRSVGLFVAIGGFGMLTLVLGMVLAKQLFEQPAATPTASASEPSASSAGPDMVFIEVPTENPEEGATATEGTTGAGATRAGGTKSTKRTTTADTPAAGTLSKAEQEMIERMGGKAGGSFSTIKAGSEEGAGGGRVAQLSSQQLTEVITRRRVEAQRCYERIFRGRTNIPEIRVTVTLNISAAGRVSSATASGGGGEFSELRSCIEGQARRWVFPASSGATDTVFPLVFSAST